MKRSIRQAGHNDAGGFLEPMDAESAAWIAAVAAALATPEEHVLSPELDLGGHELALLDFDPRDLDRLRRIGRLIEIPDEPDVQTALAISGSTAQAKIHPFPADADFFERVHILAPNRPRAIARLAELVRANALAADHRPELGLDEVCFGRFAASPGKALRWTVPAVREGALVRRLDSGETERVTWAAAAADPAFVKLDWILLDPALGGPAKVTKVIDATWEAPDGAIESLDGLIDADFQQVYLSARDALVAARLVGEAGPDLGRALYLRFMEQEIVKYLHQDPPDYVKVAKRLYNRCRLSGHFAEAVWLRGLFDDPPGRLGLLRTELELISARWVDDADAVVALQRLAGIAAEVLTALGSDALPVTPGLSGDRSAERVRREVAALDEALTEALVATFGRRLLNCPPVATLLQEIVAETRSPVDADPA
jgi:hypothetical protein